MKLFAHDRHIYEDRGYRGRPYFMEWARDQWRDVPDDIAGILLGASEKFCDVTGDEHPEQHRCSKTNRYSVVQYAAPVTVDMAAAEGGGRPSRQRLEARRDTYKRSSVARVNPAARGG